MLEVSKMSVYRLISAKLISARRIGRANWIPRASVNQFLRDSRPTPGTWTRPTPDNHPATSTEPHQPTDSHPDRPPHPDIIDNYSV
jgi:excisionase family DNA binding protein